MRQSRMGSLSKPSSPSLCAPRTVRERKKDAFSFPSPSGRAGLSSRVLTAGRLPSAEQSCFL